jgi:hypothetical protein
LLNVQTVVMPPSEMWHGCVCFRALHLGSYGKIALSHCPSKVLWRGWGETWQFVEIVIIFCTKIKSKKILVNI